MAHPRWMGCANNKLRSGVIGSTSQGTHDFTHCFVFTSGSSPRSARRLMPRPHAALPPANITSPCLRSLLQILLRSLCRADGSAAGVAPCWGSRCIIALHQQSRFQSFKVVFFNCSMFFCVCAFTVQPRRPSQRLKRCPGTTLAPSCPRSPTDGRAPPTPTSSTAPWSPTSATLDISWPALRSSCASGISHGVATYQDVKKVI